MKTLVIGNTAIEILCPYKGAINENNVYNFKEKLENCGGSAGVISTLLAKWGFECYIGSVIGSDDFGNKIKKDFETIGVKTDFLETVYDRNTNQTIILLNDTSKNQIIFEIDNQMYLKRYIFPIEPELIITDGSDYAASMAALDKYSKVFSILLANKHTKEVQEIAKFVKYIVFNQKTAESITNKNMDFENSATLVGVYNDIKSKYQNQEVIITLGEKGSIYAVNGQVKIMPPIRIAVEDSYGAGSIYTAIFAFGISKNLGIEKSIAYATIGSSFSVSKKGCRNSIPSLIEVSNYYDENFGKVTEQASIENKSEEVK